ncbi:MAG: PhoH family protein [Kiritimatiellia bacterium]|jgi:PhoH-like ATPase|nr:PhoH family protein [Kiritimatiellia bacterium]MDP6629620.1 PhoH family protein [Kiritimatiellia bacterium]MDP6809327.1 PhoH family protein [Kiritimatiellia bacterium]MDP7023066.1 PhoH family protein [Kiritimatiellia bacterium]
MTDAERKIFILDTNVILHDSACIDQFEEHDVVIPIVVLEELDHFKKGHESISYHARTFLRKLDDLSGDKLFEDGVRMGPGRGRLSVGLARPMHQDLRLNFAGSEPDHRILNIGYTLAEEHTDRDVFLVSKDVNLRLKAKAVGLKAHDYTTDRVRDVSELYTGKRMEEDVDPELVERLYTAPQELPVAEVPFGDDLTPNEFVILRCGKKSGLGTYDAEGKMLRHVDKAPVYNIMPRNAEQIFALCALLNPAIPLVTLTGKAGTGKTLLALAAALESRKQYKQILLARPIVPLSNKDTGFLPGEIDEKLAPYMQPLYDNLGVIRNQFAKSDTRHKNIRKLLDEEELVITPLSYIRGRSLVNTFFIVDEGQNLTPHEIKTIITRAGEGTKIVFTGDIYQIDHPYLDSQSNGLSHLIEKMRGQLIYAHVNLEKGERSDLAELASDLL